MSARMVRTLQVGLMLAILGLDMDGACFAQGGASMASPLPAPLAEVAVTRIDRLRITALSTALTQAGPSLVAAGERGRILISDDQGKTWSSAASPATASASLTALAFSDKLGIVVGHNGTVLRSEDGGRNWNAVDLVAKDQPALFAVYLDGMKAIAIGAYGAYFESRDAGKSWARRNIGADDFDKHLTGIAAIGQGQLMIAGEAGTLLRSSDDGKTWKALKSPYAGSYFGILGLKSGGVIIYGMRGNAYRSSDDGEHWQKVDLGAYAGAIQGGRELADGRILLYGNDGLLAVQAQGQDSFKVEQQKSRRTLAAVLPVDGRLLDAGPSGLHWSDGAGQ